MDWRDVVLRFRRRDLAVLGVALAIVVAAWPSVEVRCKRLPNAPLFACDAENTGPVWRWSGGGHTHVESIDARDLSAAPARGGYQVQLRSDHEVVGFPRRRTLAAAQADGEALQAFMNDTSRTELVVAGTDPAAWWIAGALVAYGLYGATLLWTGRARG